MFKTTRLLPDRSQTDRHDKNGPRAIAMPSKNSKKANRSILYRKKPANGPRLDLSLYSVEGYSNWLEKVQKLSKRNRTYS